MRFASSAILVPLLSVAIGVLGNVTTVTVTVTAPVSSVVSSTVLATTSHIRPSGVPHTASSSILIPGGPVSISSAFSSAVSSLSTSVTLSTQVVTSITNTGIPPVSIPTSLLTSSSSDAVTIPSITGVVPSTSGVSDTSGSTSASSTAPSNSATQPSSGMKAKLGFSGVAVAVTAMMVPILL